MTQGKKILGLITARGGSKRVPRKNIKEFLGKPLLAWSIETGKASGVFDRFILTTDDEEIARIGKEHGIEVPFMRPKEYAQDTTSSFEPIKHAYEWLRDNDSFDADYMILLEPNSPGRQPFHIQDAAKLIQKDDIDSLIGTTELPAHYHPHKIVEQKGDGTIIRHHEGKLYRETVVRTQDHSKLHFTNSTLYAFTPKNFYGNPPNLWGDRVYGYEMDEKYAIDIDTPEDWKLAEWKMRMLPDKN